MANVQTAPSSNRLAEWYSRSGGFLTAVVGEMKKVTWPTKPELIKATRMIIVFALALGIVIGLLDYLLQLILVDGVARLAR